MLIVNGIKTANHRFKKTCFFDVGCYAVSFYDCVWLFRVGNF